MLPMFTTIIIAISTIIINNIRIMNNNLMDSVLKVSTNGCRKINWCESNILLAD